MHRSNPASADHNLRQHCSTQTSKKTGSCDQGLVAKWHLQPLRSGGIWLRGGCVWFWFSVLSYSPTLASLPVQSVPVRCAHRTLVLRYICQPRLTCSVLSPVTCCCAQRGPGPTHRFSTLSLQFAVALVFRARLRLNLEVLQSHHA